MMFACASSVLIPLLDDCICVCAVLQLYCSFCCCFLISLRLPSASRFPPQNDMNTHTLVYTLVHTLYQLCMEHSP
jgi:hypothetical protein